MSAPEEAALSAWLSARIPDLTPPLSFTQLTVGQSHDTRAVADTSGRRLIVRSPPAGSPAEGAHDVLREARILTAFVPTDVPVPAPIAVCAEEAVIGRPFFAMDFADGTVTDATTVDRFSTSARARIGRGMAEMLARIHNIDPDRVGLGDLARPDGYVGRQIRLWNRQWAATGVAESEDYRDVYAELQERIPEQAAPAIVHGDFHVRNVLFSPDGEIRAVLDWEMCTLGDPLADLGLALVYWGDRNQRLAPYPGHATTRRGFPSRRQMIEIYASAAQHPVREMPYYLAFGSWKLAVIWQTLERRGKQATTRPYESLRPGELVAGLLAQARRILEP